MRKLLLAALTCVALTTPALAATPWDGTWKLDLSKSHLAGSSFTYSKNDNGTWRYSDGSQVSYDFALDGKPYKAITSDYTLVATPNGDHAITFVYQFKGNTTSTSRQTLSADGKTLTDHNTGTHPDGSKIDDTTVYTRVSGASGFFGKWRSTKVNVSVPDSWIISTAADGTLTWNIPAYKETIQGKPDGTPLPISGPQVSPSVTIAIKQVSPHRMDYTVQFNGKTVGLGSQVLAADGKSFTDSSWNPGQESEKTTGYFVKQ
jgi:hypothetical protein